MRKVAFEQGRCVCEAMDTIFKPQWLRNKTICRLSGLETKKKMKSTKVQTLCVCVQQLTYCTGIYIQL